ncbi:MAG: DUF692 domain-containing protein [Comamonadaceae bacterium]|nr:DUF692 domain-containing protein [Comamonadaceae bacterium]
MQRPLPGRNISAYLARGSDTLTEPEFFNELCRRSGCGLLLDLNNLMVNRRNCGEDPGTAAQSAGRWVVALRPGIVGEIHLAGHCAMDDVVIDDHGSRVIPELWQLYEQTLNHLGSVPTLIEWDTGVPDLQVLLDEGAFLASPTPDGLPCRRARVMPWCSVCSSRPCWTRSGSSTAPPGLAAYWPSR